MRREREALNFYVKDSEQKTKEKRHYNSISAGGQEQK